MPRFVVITNGLVENSSFVATDEEGAIEVAKRCEKWYRVMERIGGTEFMHLPKEERDRLCEAEPIEDFVIRKVYRQPRRNPRDFRKNTGAPTHKTIGKYNPPSKF